MAGQSRAAPEPSFRSSSPIGAWATICSYPSRVGLRRPALVRAALVPVFMVAVKTSTCQGAVTFACPSLVRLMVASIQPWKSRLVIQFYRQELGEDAYWMTGYN